MFTVVRGQVKVAGGGVPFHVADNEAFLAF